MTAPRAPRIDGRRAHELLAQLRERARAWMPGWAIADGEQDFGAALLEVAARFSSEVAEQLDRGGDKLQRGFFDWLGIRGKAARPTRVPVVFKLAEKAAPVLASHPVKLQAEADGASVTFETEADVRLIPGKLDLLVAVDADKDAYFLPPPGLTTLDEEERLPTQWQLKSFADAGATKLQLDPELGLKPDMIVEAAGRDYKVTAVDKDIVAIEPPAEQQLTGGTVVRKVTSFAPYDDAAQNQQEHALYFGDANLLDIKGEVEIEIVGAQSLRERVAWEYWGKVKESDEAGWQRMKLAPVQPLTGTAVKKAEGVVEQKEFNGISSRWIRAVCKTLDSRSEPFMKNELTLRINGTACLPGACEFPPKIPPPAAEGMANTTPLVLESVFFPLGREPRQFDAFYLGSQEAFSKKDANVQLCFALADPTFTTLSRVLGPSWPSVLAGVGRDGTLHVFTLDTSARTLKIFRGRTQLKPPSPAFQGETTPTNAATLDRQPAWRLPIWTEKGDFLIGMMAGLEVWVWREAAEEAKSGWEYFGALPSTATSADANGGLCYLEDSTDAYLAALRDGELFVRDRADTGTWTKVQGGLSAIVPILEISGSVTSAAKQMLAIDAYGALYRIDPDGTAYPVDSGPFDAQVRPVAINDSSNTLKYVALSKNKIVAETSASSPLPLGPTQTVLGFDVTPDGLNFLATLRVDAGAIVKMWTPSTDVFVDFPIPSGVGLPGGPSTALATYIVIPGTRADTLGATFDAAVATATDWSRLLGDSSVNPELSWEYWNGQGWWKLDVNDETLNLKASGQVKFEIPPDFVTSDWAGKTNFWIRARLIGGDYGREKVTVKTVTVAGVTEQTVERHLEGIQAPAVTSFHISYGICAGVKPTVVLAKDSGSFRDQSAANRTGGALVEAFVPLALSLGRLSEGGAKTQAGEHCPDECGCSKPADASAAAASPESDNAKRFSGRAFFLGLTKAPSEAPVNILLLVESKADYGNFAPLTAEAFVEDHFAPVVADDTTRALGEHGVLSMAFEVEPTAKDLFGQTRHWLRLVPATGQTSDGWTPTVRGTYLNGVWASATETLTRELVGSSEGAPNITLNLARPPVLQGTLELRIKEPLGEEERAVLRAADKSVVLNDVDGLPGDWVRWRQITDPNDEGPAERVYALDESAGEIRFGDGKHGMIPPIGRDSIVAFRYQRTEAGTSGSESVPGNSIAPRSALNLVSPIESVEGVVAADQAAGGAPAESDDRVVRFAGARLRHRERAVAEEDLEDLALESSPDIAQARCLSRRSHVRLVIVKRGGDPRPAPAELRELRRLLIASAPPALGADGALRVEGPRLRRLRVDLGLRVADLGDAGAVAKSVKQQLAKFFDPAFGAADGEGWKLGESPTEGDIAYALLDAPRLEGIAAITLYEIGADGSAEPWPGGLTPTELTTLDDDPVRIHFEVVA